MQNSGHEASVDEAVTEMTNNASNNCKLIMMLRTHQILCPSLPLTGTPTYRTFMK